MQEPFYKFRREGGFSVIELVVVIVLLGIIAVVIMPRFIAPNTFNDIAAQDGIITTLRAAQQAALGRTGVTFEIDLAGSEWELAVKDSGVTIRTLQIPSRDVLLQTASAGMSGDTCATGFDIDVENDFELTFDARGDLLQFINDGDTEMVDAAFNGVRICVNNTNALSVCVSPAGYAYAGNCDE